MPWLLQKLDLDPMENDSGRAAFYAPLGIITDPAVVELLNKENVTVNPAVCWALKFWSQPIYWYQLQTLPIVGADDINSLCQHLKLPNRPPSSPLSSGPGQ